MPKGELTWESNWPIVPDFSGIRARDPATFATWTRGDFFFKKYLTSLHVAGKSGLLNGSFKQNRLLNSFVAFSVLSVLIKTCKFLKLKKRWETVIAFWNAACFEVHSKYKCAANENVSPALKMEMTFPAKIF